MTRLPFGITGTSEDVWRAWHAPAAWPTLDVVRPGRAVVVSPHPDDEALGVGGTIWTLVQYGWTVDVVAVTDGEGSHPATPERSASDLASTRRAEQRAAMDVLGVPPGRLHLLALGDGTVAEHEDAVTGLVGGLLEAGTWLLAPWERDGHRDHDATGRAAQRAAAAHGARLLRYLVWAWYWATPSHPSIATWRPVRIELSGAARDAKRAAVSRYASQIGGPDDAATDVVVPARALAHHSRSWEMLLT
ncbi:MAG TPA: PIG-L family deacetylase [Euzebyales bacterium]